MIVCTYPNCGKDQKCTDLCLESKLVDRLSHSNDYASECAAVKITDMRLEIQRLTGEAVMAKAELGAFKRNNGIE